MFALALLQRPISSSSSALAITHQLRWRHRPVYYNNPPLSSSQSSSKPPNAASAAAGNEGDELLDEYRIENSVYASAKDRIVVGTDATEELIDAKDILTSPNKDMPADASSFSEPAAAVYATAKDEMTPFSDSVEHVKAAIFHVPFEDVQPVDERFVEPAAANKSKSNMTSSDLMKERKDKEQEASVLIASSKLRTSILHPKPSRDSAQETLLRVRQMMATREDKNINPASVDPDADYGVDVPYHEHRNFPYVMQNNTEPNDDGYSATKGTYEATKDAAATAFDDVDEAVDHVTKLNNKRPTGDNKPQA